MSSFSSVYIKIKEYLDVMLIYQANLNDGLVMTYDRGYWWCTSDKKLNEYEKDFLEFGLDSEIIIEELLNTDNNEVQTNLLHLLGWVGDKKKAGDMLVGYIESEKDDQANASLRSLFPMIVAGQYKIDPKLIHKLLYSKTLVVKNKILGLIAFMSQKDMFQVLSSKDILYIKKLVKHENKPLIATPAQMVVDRLSK